MNGSLDPSLRSCRSAVIILVGILADETAAQCSGRQAEHTPSARGGNVVRLLRNTTARPVGGVSFGPHGLTLVAGGSGGFDVWDLATSSHAFVPSHAVKYLYGCVYDPRGRWIYVADYIGGFRILSVDRLVAQPAPGSPYERHVTAFDI